MAIVEHWTESADFSLAEIDTAGEGAGLFVYPESSCAAEFAERQAGWRNRQCVLLEVPDSALREVQRFSPGEAGNHQFEVVELFLPATRYSEVEFYE